MAEKAKNQKLIRSETNRVVGGVCGGLGEFFSIDPIIVRLAFVLITLFGGSGVLIYIILWLIIPSENQGAVIDKESIKKNAEEIKKSTVKMADQVKTYTQNHNPKVILGLILVGLGIVFLLDNFNIFRGIYFYKIWPVIFVILGILILTKEK